MLTATWAAKVIHVPRSDLTEIIAGVRYSLTVDRWVALLRELVGSEEGIAHTVIGTGNFPFVNTPPTLGTPRITNLINNYVVEFEDGPFTLDVIEGNSNLGDPAFRISPTDQVSVNTNNVSGFNTVQVSGGLNASQQTQLTNLSIRTHDMWNGDGYDVADPVVHSEDEISTARTTRTKSGDCETGPVTVTRTG